MDRIVNRDTLQILGRRVREHVADGLGTVTGRAIVFGFAFALVAPFVFGTYTVDTITQALIFVLVVTSWNFIAGYFGILTFTHAALFGVGGYAAAILAVEIGLPPIAAIFAAGLVAGAISLPMAISLLRLEGAYVAMLTLAYGQIIYFISITWREVTNGPTGYTEFTPLFGGDRVALFYFVLFTVAVLVAVQYVLLINRFGLVAEAIRESEAAAQMLGNNTRRYKLVGFVIGSSVAGIAGGLQAYNILIISPPMLALNQMIEFMAMGVIGGIRTLGGGVVGAVVVFGLSESLREVGNVRLLVWGLLLMATILYFPNGLVGHDRSVTELRETVGDRIRNLFDR